MSHSKIEACKKNIIIYLIFFFLMFIISHASQLVYRVLISRNKRIVQMIWQLPVYE